MYVCICNALNDRKVTAAIHDGARTYGAVMSAYGVRPQCGRCRETVEAMIDDFAKAADAQGTLAAD